MQGCDSQGIPRDILRIGMRDGDTATDWQAGRIDLLRFNKASRNPSLATLTPLSLSAMTVRT